MSWKTAKSYHPSLQKARSIAGEERRVSREDGLSPCPGAARVPEGSLPERGGLGVELEAWSPVDRHRSPHPTYVLSVPVPAGSSRRLLFSSIKLSIWLLICCFFSAMSFLKRVSD